MKVLQLTSHFYPNIGGVETHLDDLVQSLLHKKIDVFVLTYRPLTTTAPWKMFESKKHLKIFRIPWLPGFFYKFVENPLLEFLYLLPGLFFVTPIALLIEKPDVIHAHGIIAGFVGVFWGRIFNKKVIISTHSIYNFPQKSLYMSFVKEIFLHTHAVLCLSKQSKNEIVALGVPESNVYVFTYWIDLKRFSRINNAKKQLDVEGRFVVLFVGRLIEEKGVKVLLDAAKEWNSSIVLLIAGTGPLVDSVKRKSDGRHIQYVGKLSQAQLPLYYSAADILVVPSIHEEGFGRVMLESLACGTPVVAAKRGGILEAITDKVGYLLEINKKNLKITVEYCYKHRVELESKSKEARKFVSQKYSEKNVDKIIKTYA